MFLEQQIITLEGFLKDHVTPKTGVIVLTIQLFHHRNKLHFKMYSNGGLYLFELKSLNCLDALFLTVLLVVVLIDKRVW